MASMQTLSVVSSSFSCMSSKKLNVAIHVPKLPRVNFPEPKIPNGKMVEGLTFTDSTPLLEKNNVTSTGLHDDLSNSTISKSTLQLYAILEAVANRIEMHKNVGEQRDNWNTLLLNNINMITLTVATLAGVAATTGAGAPLALKLSSTLLFSAATRMLLIMNKIQPSQLAEEQRNDERLFRQLQTQIETTIALGNPTEEDVKGSMEKVLVLYKTYPLPLLGTMLDKFPAKFESAVWWPATQFQRGNKSHQGKVENKNGWSKELEMELSEVTEVVKIV